MRTSPRKINFTKAAIEGLKAPESGRVYVYDEKTAGLTVCVTAAGSKTFYLYRKVGGKPERIRLAAWPDMTVANARKHAERHNGKIAEGENPNDKRRDSRGAPTLRAMFDDYLALPTRTKAKRPKAPKTVKGYRQQFEAYLDDWANRPLSAITRADIEKRHNALAEHHGYYTANRVLSLIKALYSAAMDLGRYNANPAARLRPFEEETRERFVGADEFPRFWQALEAEPSEKVRDFFKCCLFTGQRRSNVQAMRWEDINLERGIWTLPKTKTGKHEVPLTIEALEVLRRRHKEAAEDAVYVFPGRHGSGHLTDPMRQWREILKRAGIKDLRIHDLRRSLGSWQAITGASLPIIGKSLGHRRAETTTIYARLSDDPVRASMTTATAAMMAAAREGNDDDA